MPRTRRVSFAAALGALAVTVAACGDSTGPGRSVDVAVSVTQLRGPSITPEENGQARVACSVDFRAVASGSGAATWLDATVHWYVGVNRLPLDSLVVSAAEIQASWGEAGIDAGETRASPGWEFGAGVPFSVTLDYRIVGDTFSPCQRPRVGDWPPSVDATGAHIAIGTDVYDGSLQFLRRVEATIGENSISPTALSLDGEYLYTVLLDRVLRSRVSDGVLLDRSPVPIQPTAIRASSDGAMLVTVENHSSATSTISTIDLR
jgi:hypothetical protein